VASNVSGLGDGWPHGTVVVSGAGTHCAAVLSGASGVASGACVITPRTPGGSVALVATYSRDATEDSSTSSPVTYLSVARAATTTRMTVSASRVQRGAENTERFAVRVTPRYSGVVVSGLVAVSANGRAACSISLSQGTGACRLSASQLAPGTYEVTATYHGSSRLLASRSSRVTLRVLS